MGKKNKLKKFGDLLTYPNVYENYNPKFPKLLVAADTEVNMKGVCEYSSKAGEGVVWIIKVPIID